MSDTGFINFLMINDVSRGSANAEKLADLRERAHLIEKHTGKEPVSFIEFQQQQPQKAPDTWGNLLAGASIGGVLLGGIVLLLGLVVSSVMGPQAAYGDTTALGLATFEAALGGAFIGGAIGVFRDTKNTRRNEMVDKYETYLNNFELQAGRSRAPEHSINYRDDHVAQLAAKREKEQMQTSLAANSMNLT